MKSKKKYFGNAFSAFKKTIISLESEKISKLQATNNKKFHIESNNFEDEELSIFANDLRRLPELFSEKEIYEQIPSLCFKIQFDSIIPARKMLLKAFDEYPSGVGTVYKEKVQEFIYRWQNIVYILIKISRRLSQQSLNTLNESVLSLLEDEKRIFLKVSWRKIEMSVFDITNRCNLKCIYCCRGESLNKQVDEVSTEDVLNTIKQIVDIRWEFYCLTGGRTSYKKRYS